MGPNIPVGPEHPLTDGLSALYAGDDGRESGRPELTHGPEGAADPRTFRLLGLYPFIPPMLITDDARDEVNAELLAFARATAGAPKRRRQMAGAGV